jgi:hypothetical protein
MIEAASCGRSLAIRSTSHVQSQQLRLGWTAKYSTIVEEGLSGRIFDLVLRDGRHQRVLYLSPAKPAGVVVMFPGGSGDIGLREDGRIDHGDNFVVRTRLLWVKHGYALLIPDTIDHNLRGERKPGCLAVIRTDRVCALRASAPVFLLGTVWINRRFGAGGRRSIIRSRRGRFRSSHGLVVAGKRFSPHFQRTSACRHSSSQIGPTDALSHRRRPRRKLRPPCQIRRTFVSNLSTEE